MGDIYHSQLVVVGKPSAETAFVGQIKKLIGDLLKNMIHGKLHSSRKETVYVGSNDGMLHAFDAGSGKEIWGFVPPFIASSMPNMVNNKLK